MGPGESVVGEILKCQKTPIEQSLMKIKYSVQPGGIRLRAEIRWCFRNRKLQSLMDVYILRNLCLLPKQNK